MLSQRLAICNCMTDTGQPETATFFFSCKIAKNLQYLDANNFFSTKTALLAIGGVKKWRFWNRFAEQTLALCQDRFCFSKWPMCNGAF